MATHLQNTQRDRAADCSRPTYNAVSQRGIWSCFAFNCEKHMNACDSWTLLHVFIYNLNCATDTEEDENVWRKSHGVKKKQTLVLILFFLHEWRDTVQIFNGHK